MTTMTCTKCGHSGEAMAGAPGFCARCGVAVAVMASIDARPATAANTCLSCGHSGEHITNARGFCTACGNLPSRKGDPIQKSMVTCLRCGTVREHDVACATCAGLVGGKTASIADKSTMHLMLPMSFFIATVATLIHWTFLFIFGKAVGMASEIPAAIINTPVAGAAPFGAFNVGLNLGGVVATAIFWIMAYKRHPFIGVAAGVSGGAIVTLFCWLLGAAL